MRDAFEKTLKPIYVFARSRIAHVLFERPMDVHTSDVVPLENLGLAAEHRRDHEPSGWTSLKRILPSREVTKDDVFIDFGSGMGRVVLQAAQYPFKRVIGVELSPQLHAVAEENVDRASPHQRCKEIELVNRDVLYYDLPDDVTVAFFNNPFAGYIFQSVVRNLVESVARNPRTLRIVYLNPVEEPMLFDMGARPVRQVRGLRPTREWSRSHSIRMYVIEPKEQGQDG